MLDLEQEYAAEIEAAEEEFARIAQEEFDAVVAAEAWEFM